MGEKIELGKPTIYIGWKPVEVAPATVLSLDPAGGEDKSAVNVWEEGPLNYELTFSISSEDNPVGKWFQRMLRNFKRNRKALSFALTHGFIIRIPTETERGERGYFELTKPRQLNCLLRYCKFIPQYRIFDKDMNPCIVKRGKLYRHRIYWPVDQRMLNAIDEAFIAQKGDPWPEITKKIKSVKS